MKKLLFGVVIFEDESNYMDDMEGFSEGIKALSKVITPKKRS